MKYPRDKISDCDYSVTPRVCIKPKHRSDETEENGQEKRDAYIERQDGNKHAAPMFTYVFPCARSFRPQQPQTHQECLGPAMQRLLAGGGV